MDVAFSWALFAVDRELSSKLMVKRIKPGRYEVDGRTVTLSWANSQGLAGGGRILVREEDVSNSEALLGAYLSQAAHVAAALNGLGKGTSAVSRIPMQQRLTFSRDDNTEDNTSSLDAVGNNERCRSMRIAVEQARKRHEAAQAFETGGGNSSLVSL